MDCRVDEDDGMGRWRTSLEQGIIEQFGQATSAYLLQVINCTGGARSWSLIFCFPAEHTWERPETSHQWLRCALLHAMCCKSAKKEHKLANG